MDDRDSKAVAGLDIAANRRATKWSRRELAARAVWEAVGFLFTWSPRQLWAWRNLMLRLFGARVGRAVRVHPSVRVTAPWNLTLGDFAAVGDRAILYNLGVITIGPKVTISQGAHVCAGTHDHHRADMPLVKRPIALAEGAWICADAFLGPGVEVGEYAIVGARAVVTRSVAAWTIVAGNPARPTGRRPPLEPV